jgi:hypothetical protein
VAEAVSGPNKGGFDERGLIVVSSIGLCAACAESPADEITPAGKTEIGSDADGDTGADDVAFA